MKYAKPKTVAHNSSPPRLFTIRFSLTLFAVSLCLGGGFLSSARPVAAQIRIGDEMSLGGLDGNLFTGYGSGWSNNGPTAHDLAIGGSVGTNGYYFSPQFLSFYANDTYDRGQANAQQLSITHADQFGAGAGIFGGSQFPGSINFYKGFNTTGTAAAPELQGLTTHGDSSVLQASWGAYLHGLPSLSANYTDSSSSTTIFGTEGSTTSDQHNFSLGSAYGMGWHNWKMTMDGRYTHNWGVTGTPAYVTGEEQSAEQSSSGSTEGFHFGAGHLFPLHGNFSATFGRTMYDYSFGSDKDSGTADTANAILTFRPTRKLGLVFDAAYIDSALDSLTPDIASSASLNNNLGTFRTTMLQSSTSYPVWRYASVGITFTREDQFFAGQHYGVNQWGLNGNFTPSWGKKLGDIVISTSLYDSATQAGNTSLGGSANANFRREMDGWKIRANFGYQQNVQTILVVYTISSMSYGANVDHKFGNISWTAGFGGGHSGLSPEKGTTSHSESYFTNLNWRSYSLAGSYSQGSGMSIFTPSGLVAVNPASQPLVSQNALIFYNSKAYSVNFGAQPFRGAMLTAGYFNSIGSTTNTASSALENLFPGLQNFYYANNWLQGTFVYNFRKLAFSAQFLKFRQIAGEGVPPAEADAYSFGISRAFHAF